MTVDLAGAGIKKTISEGATITVAFKTPISHEEKTATIKAIVFPTTRHDVIIGMRDIIKHMIPLTTELLLSATPHVDMTRAISGLAGDLYSICALNNEGEDYEALPITAEESGDEQDGGGCRWALGAPELLLGGCDGLRFTCTRIFGLDHRTREKLR
jgi:hypothetical protein